MTIVLSQLVLNLYVLTETAIVLLDSHTGSLLVGQGKKRDQKLKCKYFSNNNKRPSFLFESVS